MTAEAQGSAYVELVATNAARIALRICALKHADACLHALELLCPTDGTRAMRDLCAEAREAVARALADGDA